MVCSIRGILALVVSSLVASAQQVPIGGEQPAFDIVPHKHLTYDNHTTYRQDVCARYEQVRTGTIPLKDSLRGLQIRAMFNPDNDIYFNYHPETGIDPDYPGLAGVVMDKIAERAGFTWRQSFGVAQHAPEYNMTYTELLWYAVNYFDIAVYTWDHSLERLELGVTFVENYMDGSIILIDKIGQDEVKTNMDVLWNWLRPFDYTVWVLIAFTIVASGLVYQMIELMNGEQQGRPKGQWFLDNLYLSALSFTTNFEYAPRTTAGRIFAFSMAFWALVVSATYTANLASLFVVENQIGNFVSSIEEAAARKIPICTEQDTNADVLIKERYQSIERRPQPDMAAMYQALQSGECGLLLETKSGWAANQGKKEYNPDCNLYQVGSPVAEIKSGFAVKADVGYKCSGLIRGVFDLYLQELIVEGVVDEAWKMYLARVRDFDCQNGVPEPIGMAGLEPVNDGTRSRHLRSLAVRAMLKSTDSGAGDSSSSGSSEDESSLALEQMLGTFLLHYGLMLLAVLVSLLSLVWRRLTKSWGWPQPVPVTVRGPGPIIGVPPTLEGCQGSGGRTAIRAHGSPIGKPNQLTINTYVLPEKYPMENITDSNSEHFLDENDGSSTSQNGQMERARSCEFGMGQQEEPSIDAAALSRLQQHFDAEILKTAQQYEEKMNQHMGIIVTMLNDMRKEEKQFRKDTQSSMKEIYTALGIPSSAPLEGETTAKRDFGQYLRQSQQGEAD